jgi:hypothetical protein
MTFVKEHLTRTIRKQSVAELKGEIRHIFNTITPVMFRWASHRTWRLMQLCVDNDGNHTNLLDG